MSENPSLALLQLYMVRSQLDLAIRMREEEEGMAPESQTEQEQPEGNFDPDGDA